MATIKFTPRPRPKNTNEPLTYDTSDGGTLVKQRNKWRLNWAGLRTDFSSKLELLRTLRMLGHQVIGL